MVKQSGSGGGGQAPLHGLSTLFKGFRHGAEELLDKLSLGGCVSM
jgi:hypothetical protein